MNIATLGGIAAPVLVFLAAIAGYIFKQHNDKREREAKIEKEKADREDATKAASAALEIQQRKEQFDQMQETLEANRTELRSMQGDLNAARVEIGRLWSEITALRRENDAQEAHIAEMHRWDENGRTGPMPRRTKTDG